MKPGDVFLAFILGTLILILFACFLIAFLIHHKRKQQMNLAEKLQLQHQYQQELLQSRLEVQEQAFNNFSQEIHDNVGQVLSLVKMHLYKIGLKADSSLQEDVGRTNELLSKAINDLRDISHTLSNTFIAKAGLTESLQKELDYISSARETECVLQITGEPYSMDPERELVIFRIVQEALANALKHGAPTHITLQCHYAPGTLSIHIRDNGKGFDTSGLPDSDGIGLSNMQIRAKLLQGSLRITSVPGQGTHLHLQINTASYDQD